MTKIPEEVDAGAVVTVSCSVTHTCSSHPPEFSWSVSDLTKEATHTMSPQGTWKTTSTITFLADGGDGEKRLTCTATYWRGRKQSSSAQLIVKGQSKPLGLLLCHKFRSVLLFLKKSNAKHQQDHWVSRWSGLSQSQSLSQFLSWVVSW